MTTAQQTKQPNARALRYYALLISLYIVLIFALPANSGALQRYNLSAIQYHAILLTIMLPSLAIWLVAFIGYAKLQQYTEAIKGTPERPHFAQLTRGCAWLAWSLPLTTISSLVWNGLAAVWHSFHPAAVIISNYLNLVFPLIAFSVISGASRNLMNSRPEAKLNQKSAQTIVAGFLTAGVLYCYLTFRRFDLSSLGSTHNPYFLPLWLMIITVTVPYLYTWFIGLLATYELTLFTKQAQGILYRKALRFVIGGLIAVILSSIALQYTTTLALHNSYLVIDYRLLVISVFKIIGGAGFVMLAIGAIRLKKIEEI